MGRITNSINKLIVDTSGGIVAFWGIITYFVIKILRWCGSKISEGAIKDTVDKMVDKILPIIKIQIDEKFKKIEDDVHEIKNSRAGKDGVIYEVLDQLKILNDKKND